MSVCVLHVESKIAGQTHHMLEGNLLEWVQGRRYWVQWVELSTAGEAQHMAEHCDDTVN